MKTTKLFVIPFVMLCIAGCSTENLDITAPQIDTITYIPAPIEAEVCGAMEPVVFILKGGEDLSFDAIFTDDKELAQYKVDIHNNFDCHGHGGGSAPSVTVPNVNNQTTDWTVLEIRDISGVSSAVARTLEVPQNVTAGNYHIHIQTLDEAGNSTPFANFHSLKIKNPTDEVSPQISVNEPANSSFSIQKGSTIRFAGQVTDNHSLSDGGNGVLYLAYTDLSSGNTFNTGEAFPFDENVGTSFDFDFEYVVPLTLTSGNYRFSLGANDGVRNVAEFQFFEVEVTN